MTLLSGKSLDPKRFFKYGKAKVQGSSFDLTVGKIFDTRGNEVSGVFTLKPGHMVQVMSAEVFNLEPTITGHVTYKTSLTRVGIWALTVGIVDPGWDGPIATTLLNFSRRDHAINTGDAFLRVSFFEHERVPQNILRKSKPVPEYTKEFATLAATNFPKTFLNSKKIETGASTAVLSHIRKTALAWVAAIVIVFTIAQLVVAFFAPRLDGNNGEIATLKSEIAKLHNEIEKSSNSELDQLKSELTALQKSFKTLRQSNELPAPKSTTEPSPTNVEK